jgi:hypothetical protein
MMDGRSTGSVSTGSAIRTAGVLIENQKAVDLVLIMLLFYFGSVAM